ncbi:hypothetical protein RFF05_14260 [Bengtsoniella intestinalis]|uniref:hypothetical protein n=1 Tax=Bengtsoniella intestinalis TaxID=3073143 RepID=UPI00391EF569
MREPNNSNKAAQIAKSLAHIAYGAATAGLHGAAVAAVKESIPLLIKIALWTVVLCIIIPLVVFISIPNIFFGFDSSIDGDLEAMTEQAMLLGSTYMNLEEFELSWMDSVVTKLAEEYREEGTEIDRIEVINNLTIEDFYWLMAIQSVANSQDVWLMSSGGLEAYSISRISYKPSLGSILSGEISITVLTVTFNAIDPAQLMEILSFDDQAVLWTTALYESLSQSDAATLYGDSFDSYTPSYDGDDYNGAYIPGGTAETTIDISGFTDPGTKNSTDLAAYALQAWENGWGYVWGTYGNILTQSLLDYKVSQYPDGVGNYESFIQANYLGSRTTDCVGLIKGYGWLDTDDLTIGYAINGMPDYGANQMYSSATVFGPIATIPDIPGIAVWKSGHIGVYVGDGMVVEAMGTTSGVVMTELDGRGWTNWCEIPYIDYS